MEGKAFVEAVGEGIACDVRQRDEQSKLEEEDTDSQEEERLVLEDAKIRMGANILGGRKSLFHKEVRDDEQAQADEAERSHGPAPADARIQRLQHQWEDDAADAASGAGNAGGQPAASAKEVAHSCGAGREEEGRAHAAQHPEGEDEVPILYEGRVNRGLGICTAAGAQGGSFLPVHTLVIMRLATMATLPGPMSHRGPYLSKSGPI